MVESILQMADSGGHGSAETGSMGKKTSKFKLPKLKDWFPKSGDHKSKSSATLRPSTPPATQNIETKDSKVRHEEPTSSTVPRMSSVDPVLGMNQAMTASVSTRNARIISMSAPSTQNSRLMVHSQSLDNTSQNVLDSDPPILAPISELWNQEYYDLRVKEEKLMKDYEETLFGNF
jgi:hypothetical protein